MVGRQYAGNSYGKYFPKETLTEFNSTIFTDFKLARKKVYYLKACVYISNILVVYLRPYKCITLLCDFLAQKRHMNSYTVCRQLRQNCHALFCNVQ